MPRNRTWRVGVSHPMRLLVALLVACRVDGGGEPGVDAGVGASPSPDREVASRPDSPSSPELADVLPRWEAAPGPGRGRGERAVRDNAECEGCHVDEAREWRASGHRSAFVEAAFQVALAAEPSAFCRGCHAPEADPRLGTRQPAHSIGVGCVTCHVDPAGRVLAAPHRGVDDVGAPHEIVRAAGMATAEACAGCHEFAFPGARFPGDEGLMQTTVREHARSPSASRPCAGCHMPVVGDRRDHSFASVRDPAWLREALSVEAERGGGDTLLVTLTQTSPGHAFPTGDLFRRLEVGATLEGPGRTSRAAEHLARHFVIDTGTPARKLLLDDRVFFEPKVVELHLEGLDARSPGSRVKWWVKLQRVSTPLTGREPEHAIIESEVVLHEGTLRPEAHP